MAMPDWDDTFDQLIFDRHSHVPTRETFDDYDDVVVPDLNLVIIEEDDLNSDHQIVPDINYDMMIAYANSADPPSYQYLQLSSFA